MKKRAVTFMGYKFLYNILVWFPNETISKTLAKRIGDLGQIN